MHASRHSLSCCRWDHRHDTSLQLSHFYRHRGAVAAKRAFESAPGQAGSPKARQRGSAQDSPGAAEHHRGIDTRNAVAAALGKVKYLSRMQSAQSASCCSKEMTVTYQGYMCGQSEQHDNLWQVSHAQTAVRLAGWLGLCRQPQRLKLKTSMGRPPSHAGLSQITNHKSQITNHKSQITIHNSQFTIHQQA